jgi:hypothetical protein
MSVGAFLKRTNTRDTIVYWDVADSLNADGTTAFLPPVEIGCTWKGDRRMIKDFWEKEVASRAHVYVDVDLIEKAMIYHGKISDLSDAQLADPRLVPDAYEVLRFMKTPSLGVRNSYDRKAFL